MRILVCVRRFCAVAAIALTAFFGQPVAGSVAKFVPLGFLPNGNDMSGATGVTDAGGVVTVVGYANTPSLSREGFIWTQAGGMVGLGGYGQANGISADGTEVVGTTFTTAWSWKPSTGYTYLGAGQAYAASANGSVIVGETGDVGWRWTSATGRVNLPFTPAENGNYNPAFAVSADGNYIVGQSNNAQAVAVPYLYNWSTGKFTMLPVASYGGTAQAVSPDGSIVGGGAAVGGDEDMGRWINGALVTTVKGATASITWGMSNDGNTMVGQALNTKGGTALIWTANQGLITLQADLTQNYGIDLTGWTLEDATAVSGDGNAIVGYGIDPQGYTEAFVFEVPEPGALMLLSLPVSLLMLKRARSA